MRHTAAIASFTALTLAGCGSTALSTQQLRSSATRVCTTARAQTNRIPTPAEPAGGTAFLRRGVTVLGPELTQLRSLRPPSDLARTYATALGAFALRLSELRSTVHQLEGGADPVIAIKTLQQHLAPLESQERGAWDSLQIPACGNE